MTSIAINCKEICEDLLINFNITPRKSLTLKPPLKIKDDYLKMCYIKGVIDGDGSVCNNRIVIYGTKELLEWIKENFDNWIPKNNRKTSMVRQIQNNLYVYTIGSSRKDYIYVKFKSLKCDYLERKWDTY